MQISFPCASFTSADSCMQVFACFRRTSTFDSWVFTNAVVLIAAVSLIVFLMLPLGLFCFHTVLVFTDQTTWEFTKRHRITYLKSLPENVFPFSHGVFANLWAVFYRYPHQMTLAQCHERWCRDLADIEKRLQEGEAGLAQLEAEHCNIWSNKYYSCC